MNHETANWIRRSWWKDWLSPAATKSEGLAGWRKIAGAVWDPPKDPQMFGAFDVDASQAIALIERARNRGEHVTPTHLVGRAVAQALVSVPELNVRLVWGRAVPRGSVDLFFVTAGGDRALTGVKVANVEHKSVVDVAGELTERSARLNAGLDPDLAQAKHTMELLPRPLLRLVLRIAGWIAGDYDIAIPALGVPRTPFGSAIVTNVGMAGLQVGFSPLVALYRVPLMVVAGEITEKAVVVRGRVEARAMLPVSVSVDHRYVGRRQLAVALATFRRYLETPASFEPNEAEERPATNGNASRHNGGPHSDGARFMNDAGRELEAICRMRDELRLKLHLASLEATGEWDRLERRWEELDSLDATTLFSDLREGYEKVRSLLGSSGGRA